MIRMLSVVVLLGAAGVLSAAETVSVAVAGNLLPAMKEINQRFESASTYSVRISSASTAKLTTQILHGAPYDVLLAANEREPRRIMHAKALDESHISLFARGQLVLLVSGSRSREDLWRQMLASDQRIAIANPKLAPFGLAAMQVLQSQGVEESVLSRLIRTENVTQAFQYISSGQTGFGFVALSQVSVAKNNELNYQIIPDDWYQPVDQAMLRLNNKVSTQHYVEFIRSREIQQLLQTKYGYKAAGS